MDKHHVCNSWRNSNGIICLLPFTTRRNSSETRSHGDTGGGGTWPLYSYLLALLSMTPQYVVVFLSNTSICGEIRAFTFGLVPRRHLSDCGDKINELLSLQEWNRKRLLLVRRYEYFSEGYSCFMLKRKKYVIGWLVVFLYCISTVGSPT